MRDSDIEVLLSSDSDYEKLTAEIFYKGKFVALLSQDNSLSNLQLEFADAKVVEDLVIRRIDLDIFEKALELAKRKLTSA